MTTNLSQWHGASLHSHPVATESFASSGPVPPPYSGSVVDLPALPFPDIAQGVFEPDPSSSTLATEDSTSLYSCDDWVREPTSNACPYGNPLCPGGDECWALHPLGFETNPSSVYQSIPEAAQAISAQNTLCQPSASSGYPGSSVAEGSHLSNMRITYPPPPEPNQASARITPSLAPNQPFFSDIHASEQYTKSKTRTNNAAQSHRRKGASAKTRREKRRTPPRPSPRTKSAKPRAEDPCLPREKGSQINPPTGARTDSLEDLLSRLSPEEQYVVKERLKGTYWKHIRDGYKWKDLKSRSTLANVLSDLRKKHDVIQQILPSRQDPLAKASSSRNTQGPVEIPGNIYGLQDH
ncbi:hypothetical protein FMUND_11904 [Fusarium mundagurra]|uniref:Uncharacterized protein n=1 Tax=Fusarium mundagurra TaxID=1567541 RepID=A0A8H5Y514_9HYPO|nr:hypothetical protein FMUND_11904 [Fusarium mundagurra]